VWYNPQGETTKYDGVVKWQFRAGASGVESRYPLRTSVVLGCFLRSDRLQDRWNICPSLVQQYYPKLAHLFPEKDADDRFENYFPWEPASANPNDVDNHLYISGRFVADSERRKYWLRLKVALGLSPESVLTEFEQRQADIDQPWLLPEAAKWVNKRDYSKFGDFPLD
jgi:hypothetical protein